MNFSHAYKETRKYNKYYKDAELVDEILQYFATHESWTYKLKDLASKVNIPSSVLCKWRKNYENDHSYRPGGKYGSHRRRFTDVQERAIKDFLVIQYIIPGKIVRRKHLRAIFFNIWKSYDLESRGTLEHNFFTNHFVTNFCKRNSLSLRQMRKKKRSEIDEEEAQQFANDFLEVFSNMPWNLILNMDETPWNFVYTRGEVLAQKGTEEVNAKLPEDYRKCFTTIATISADGNRFPPIFLAKGSTNKCHQQFEGMTSDDNDYLLYHSAGGNTDDEVMDFYLHRVHEWVQNKHCALILDQYKSHVSESTKRIAQELNIRLVFVPTSGTDLYQPLDLRVFGTLKSMACSAFYDHAFETDESFTKPMAADLFVKLWKKLGRNVIVSAWKLADFSSSDDENDSDPTFSPHDSEYDSEADSYDDPPVDEEEVEIVARKEKEPRLTPPRN